MFNNIRIRTKLLASFIVVVILAGITGYVGILKMKSIANGDVKLYEKITVPLGQVTDLMSAYGRIRVNIPEAFYTTNESEKNNYFIQIHELSNQFEDNLKRIEANTYSADGQKIISDIKTGFNTYVTDISEIKTMLDTDHKIGAQEFLQGKISHDNLELEKSMNDYHVFELKLASQTYNENTFLSTETVSYMVVMILIVLVVAVILGVLISGNIQQLIKKVVKQTKDLTSA